MLGRGASKAEPLLGILPPNSITGPFSLTICCFTAFVVAVLLVWTRFHKRSFAMLAEGMLGFRHIYREHVPQPPYFLKLNRPKLVADPVMMNRSCMNAYQGFQYSLHSMRANSSALSFGKSDNPNLTVGFEKAPSSSSFNSQSVGFTQIHTSRPGMLS